MTDLTGQHYIDGNWVSAGQTFESDPVSGTPLHVHSGGKAEIDAAMKAAEAAFETYGWTSREDRALFLDAIAEEIEARVDAITEIGMAETGLPEPRLRSVELPRTANQLRLFATHIRDGAYLDRRHDEALPDRQPMPRPDLRMIQRPLGPVAVFGASNFPLAFSTAGGDTAAALAAGCPVVYKGHPAHPGCGELVARAIAAASEKTGMPAGVFGFIQSNTNEAGEALVTHSITRAVGFTGSFRGGKALFDLAMARPEPIPFFGELGAINPVFVLPAAQAARGGEIGAAWAGSLTMGVGQFCTNPGVVILTEGEGAEAFLTQAAEALGKVPAQPMLTAGVAKAYRGGVEAVSGTDGVERILAASCEGRQGAPAVFAVSGDDWQAHPVLAHEIFGPAGIVVRAKDAGQRRAIAADLAGQLTATLQMDDGDTDDAKALMPILERKAGRVLVNGFPTGVEVAHAMVHGGPFPASTNFGATSVGTLAIRRFLRPVCYQNMPQALLPEDLRD
jgi:NADP-dependent aldehyde dehydrogenase